MMMPYISHHILNDGAVYNPSYLFMTYWWLTYANTQ